jgi:hypothetical protein
MTWSAALVVTGAVFEFAGGVAIGFADFRPRAARPVTTSSVR